MGGGRKEEAAAAARAVAAGQRGARAHPEARCVCAYTLCIGDSSCAQFHSLLKQTATK